MKTNFTFVPASESWINSFASVRPFETKIAQEVQIGYTVESTAKFGVLGICEDIGPQANGGLPGAKSAFEAFLGKFLNMQSNRFLSGKELTFVGFIRQNTDFTTQEEGRLLVEELDELVAAQVAEILANGLIPIVIGGGHNNAFPIIKAVSEHENKAISVVNCDPHADFRVLEGRHSGNPFSYADDLGYLGNYTMLGLHKNYNSEEMLQRLDTRGFSYTFFDDYIHEQGDFRSDVKKLCLSTEKLGVELDLDAIQFMPSSALTPSGFTLEEVRFYIRMLAQTQRVHYLHLPEGATKDELGKSLVGKALAYLVSDFIALH
jgi:formiminoglutamase